MANSLTDSQSQHSRPFRQVPTPPAAPQLLQTVSASRPTALPIPECASADAPPTPSAVSRVLSPARAALPPSVSAYDPTLHGCGANTQSAPRPRAILEKAASARAR